MSDESIDLRGTQGSVVLPAGTVVQHYAAPTTTTHNTMDESRILQEHTIDIALLKNDVADNKAEIRELWSTAHRFEAMWKPKTIDAWVILVVLGLGFTAVVAAIYLGGTLGG